MNGWALEEESLDTTSGVRAPASRAKGVFFAEQEDDRLVHQQPSSRRQQRGSKEVVLQSDGEDDDEDPVEVRVPPAGKLQATPKAAGDTASYSSSKVKAGGKEDELSGADVVASAEAVSRPHARSEKTARTESLMETDAYVHHLVRDFLRAQGHNDVLQMLDEEKPVIVPTEQDLNALNERILGAPDGSSSSQSLMEQLLVGWNKRVHGRKMEAKAPRRSSKSSRSSKEPSASSSSSKDSSKRKVKPTLQVNTTLGDVSSNGNAADADGGSDEGEFNRLHHPGSTPMAHQSAAAAILGEPGSTPRARGSDLVALGFEDIDVDAPIPSENLPELDLQLATAEEAPSECPSVSQYAQQKRAAGHPPAKRVQLGDPGETPTKEYIFFRETPPRFVTETVEAAREVLEQLVQDPAFVQEGSVQQERFVELSSSDVGKYKIGQQVENLGSQRNVTGVVAKLYGSRQCGSGGPGTIIIDTWPASNESA